MNPAQFPGDLPLPTDLHKYRQAVLPTVTGGSVSQALTKEQTSRLVENIGYYPEVQAATIVYLAENPSKELIAKMAEAVLDRIKTPGASPSDAERIQAINAVTAALEAASAFVLPEEIPF